MTRTTSSTRKLSTRTSRTRPFHGARSAAPALGLLAAVVVAAPAAADTPALTEQITTAVTTSPATAGVGTDAYAVADVRTAASDPTWAAAALVPAVPDELEAATVVLQQVDGTWAVVSLGTAGVGCEETTPAVARDLTLLC